MTHPTAYLLLFSWWFLWLGFSRPAIRENNKANLHNILKETWPCCNITLSYILKYLVQKLEIYFWLSLLLCKFSFHENFQNNFQKKKKKILTFEVLGGNGFF